MIRNFFCDREAPPLFSPFEKGGKPCQGGFISAFAHHLVFRLPDNRVIAPSKEKRFQIVRAINQLITKYKVLSWRLADTHLHVLLINQRKECGLFARYLASSIKKRLQLDISFSNTYIKEIENQSHLMKTFMYHLNQGSHHGLDNDPYLDGSIIPDLLGLRVMIHPSPNYMKEHLPRVKMKELKALTQLSFNSEIQSFDLLAEAAAAAIGLSSLQGNSPSARAARTAAYYLAKDKVENKYLTNLLKTSRRTLYRQQKLTPESHIVKAIEGQLRIRQP